MSHRQHLHARLTRLATAYDGDSDGDGITFELPEDYQQLSADRLAELRSEAVEAFRAVRESAGGSPTDEDVQALRGLSQAVQAIRAEEESRAEQSQTNAEEAEALAAQVDPPAPDDDGEGEGEPAVEAAEPEQDVEAADPEPEQVAAAAGPIRVSLPRVHTTRRDPVEEDPQVPTIVASADLGGVPAGEEVSIETVAEQLLRRTQGMTESSYRAAFDSGRRQRNSIGLMSITKGFPESLQATADNGHEVLGRAVDQHRLPGGSLVAAGGWCSPSQTVYDLASELESSDGLLDVPEFQVVRGGIRFTRGPDFATLYSQPSFSYTEAEDIAGDYDGYGGGEKPCFRVDCPEFEDVRLDVNGVCITAGILQNRAYPEVTARTIRGALVAHEHRLAAQIITAMAADSTAVAWPAGQVGATAPILTAVEAQTAHYREIHRMNDGAVLEAVFPRWVRGMIRADLARRLGVDLISVPDSRITEWFSQRGVRVQFVYNYQALTAAAGSYTAFPTEVAFLLYAAGTWARGSSDVITMDAIFDSALLRENDYSALFTEEGWLVARRGHDSREVTVPICADGAVHGGVLIDCDGSLEA